MVERNGNITELVNKLKESILSAFRKLDRTKEPVFVVPEVPPLKIAGTNNYRAALAVGDPDFGLILFHHAEIFRDSLEKKTENPIEKNPLRVLSAIKRQAETLLSVWEELLDPEGRGTLILPISHVLYGFNYDRRSLPEDVYIEDLEPIETLSKIKSNLQKKFSFYEKLPLTERVRKLELAGSALAGATAIRKRIEVPKRVPDEGSIAFIIRDLEQHISASDRHLLADFVREWEGIQRIRGLAGSGKTAMLALKAFHLHYRHPDWNIAITYYSRSLYAHFEKLLNDISAYFGREINPEKLRVMHAWGGRERSGIYSSVASKIGVEAETFTRANQLALGAEPQEVFGKALSRLIIKLEDEIKKGNYKPEYDAILIDEAQDLPKEFFRLAWLITREPRRIAYAYDEMQNLAGKELPDPKALFGDQVSFEEDGENDIWLTKIYRTNRYVLVSAHTLGFGIYRPKGQVQAFDPPNTWEKIGYKLLKGKLNFGEEVVLERSKDAHDQFAEQIFTKDKVEEFIKFRVFNDKEQEITAVFDQLKADLKEGISTKNILLIANTPEEAKFYYLALKQKAWQDFSSKFSDLLFNSNLVDDEPLNIEFHLVGNTTTPEEVFREGSIAVMHIYRAKGLEAPVVYVLGCENAEPHEEASELGVEVVRRRNFIFTAITRAHGWVRIFGTGEKANSLRKEFYNLKKNEFRLAFRYPSKEEVDRMRAIRIEARKNDQVDEIANRDSEKLRSLALNAVLKELKRAGYSDDVARRLAERLIRSKDKPS